MVRAAKTFPILAAAIPCQIHCVISKASFRTCQIIIGSQVPTSEIRGHLRRRGRRRRGVPRQEFLDTIHRVLGDACENITQIGFRVETVQFGRSNQAIDRCGAYEKDRYVVVEERELDQIAPRSSRMMEVLEFVAAAEVDPVYLDASYYVMPDGAVEKPYTLLYEALRRSGYAADRFPGKQAALGAR